MKRTLYFEEENDLVFQQAVEYLFDVRQQFKAEYNPNGTSSIEFECDDRFYEQMKSEIRGLD